MILNIDFISHFTHLPAAGTAFLSPPLSAREKSDPFNFRGRFSRKLFQQICVVELCFSQIDPENYRERFANTSTACPTANGRQSMASGEMPSAIGLKRSGRTSEMTTSSWAGLVARVHGGPKPAAVVSASCSCEGGRS